MRKGTKLSLIRVLLLLPFTIALFVSSCEPGGLPVIENQRNQNINIHVTRILKDGTLGESIDYGVVPAQTIKRLQAITFLSGWVFRIEAIDTAGKVVFSHDYNMDDLEKINWKITITP